MILHIRYTWIQRIKSWFTSQPKTNVATMSLNMYQNIHKLPLTVFIDVLVSKDLTLLITQGIATEEQLLAQWELLYSEYIDAISGPEMIGKMETLKDSALVQSKISRGKLILDIISTLPDDRLIELLYSFNYPLPQFNGSNHELVINTFIAYYKNDFMNLQIMADQPDSKEVVTIDYNYFMSTIVDMNVGMKSNININELSVGAYCAYVNKYRQYCKTMSKNNKNVDDSNSF